MASLWRRSGRERWRSRASAIARLYAGFITWATKHKPRSSVAASDLDAMSRQLEAEKKKVEETMVAVQQLKADKEQMVQARAQQGDEQRETKMAFAVLESFIKEQQVVMQEAMQASSLKHVRELLYHESLRHVPTAATHGRGKGDLTARERRKSSVGVVQPRQVDPLTGRIVVQTDVDKHASELPPRRTSLFPTGGEKNASSRSQSASSTSNWGTVRREVAEDVERKQDYERIKPGQHHTPEVDDDDVRRSRRRGASR